MGRKPRTSPVAEARAEMYRVVVLECAERVFAQRGYHTAKMRDIATEAGISLNTLYAAFPGKDDLFAELHEWRGREFLARIEEALDVPAPVVESLRSAVHAYVAFLIEHPDYFRVDLREGRSWAIGDVEASPTFQAGVKRWTELMQRGLEEDVFHPGPPDVMAVTAFGIMQVQLAAWLARTDEPNVGEISERIAIQLERALCIRSE